MTLLLAVTMICAPSTINMCHRVSLGASSLVLMAELIINSLISQSEGCALGAVFVSDINYTAIPSECIQ